MSSWTSPSATKLCSIPTGSRMCCCHVGLVLLPADDLDHPTEDLVVRIRVLPLRARCACWRDRRELCHPARELILLPGRVRMRRVALQSGEAAGVAEQLTDGDDPGGPAREPVEIARDLGVQVDLARLDQLHDGQCREALGDRADHERGVRRDRHLAAEPHDPARTRRGDVAVGHHGVGQTGYARRRHLPVDEVVDGPLRTSRRKDRSHPKREDRQKCPHRIISRLMLPSRTVGRSRPCGPSTTHAVPRTCSTTPRQTLPGRSGWSSDRRGARRPAARGGVSLRTSAARREHSALPALTAVGGTHPSKCHRCGTGCSGRTYCGVFLGRVLPPQGRGRALGSTGSSWSSSAPSSAALNGARSWPVAVPSPRWSWVRPEMSVSIPSSVVRRMIRRAAWSRPTDPQIPPPLENVWFRRSGGGSARWSLDLPRRVTHPRAFVDHAREYGVSERNLRVVPAQSVVRGE